METLKEDIHGVMAMTTHGFMAAPLYLAAAGVLCAYVFYMLKPEIPAKLKTFFQKTGIYQLLENKYGVDWIYENVFARGGRLVGELLWRVGDRGLIDGLVVNGSWKVVGWVSSVVRWFQSGYLYQYALVMILGIFVLMSYFVIWPAK
jgi:NADH-quinone oxidoreductase subunit L